jgi:hypothetical protein
LFSTIIDFWAHETGFSLYLFKTMGVIAKRNDVAISKLKFSSNIFAFGFKKDAAAILCAMQRSLSNQQ